MLGLRCAGHLAGFTRLCDEFLMALDHVDGPAPFADEASALAFFDRAVRRVRSFARGMTVEGFERDASGLLVFELQGYDYAASVARVELSASAADAFESLRAPLEAESERAKRAAKGEQVPLGLLLVALHGGDEDALRRLLADARGNGFTDALAYALGATPQERAAPWYETAAPGLLMLAKKA